MKLDTSNDFEANKAKMYLNKLIEKKAKIELKEVKKSRSLDQNKYWHVACAILGDYAGYTVPEVKIIIKDQLEFMTYEKNGHRFYISSSQLDSANFTKLIEFTRSFGDSHGCYIPTPDEYYNDRFYFEKELNHML